MHAIRPLLAAALLVLFTGPASAADAWSDADKAREAVYLALHAADWGQTRYIASHPDQHVETNPILGEHPSLARVNNYFILTGLLHVGVAHLLPAQYRSAFQYLSIGVEANVVLHNYRAGIQIIF